MKERLTTNDDCGCGTGRKWILLLVVAAFFLTLIAGVLLVAGLALLWFLLSMRGGMSTPAPAPAPLPPMVMPSFDMFGLGQIGIGALLLLAALLLLLILILLVVLLFCSCGKPRWLKDLFKLLPMLKEIGVALNAAADAFAAMELGLRAAQVPVEAAGTLLHDASEKVNINIPTLSPKTADFAVLGVPVMIGLEPHNEWPLGEAKKKLADASAKLKDAPDGLSPKLGTVADQCHLASAAMRTIAGIVSPP